MTGQAWAAVVLACVTVLAASPFAVGALQRRQLLDLPNERSSHLAPTPRGGGVTLAAASLIALLVLGGTWTAGRAGLVVLGVALAGLGLAEDFVGVPAVARLAAQAAVGAVAVPLLVDSHLAGATWAAVIVCGGFWIAAFTNAFNFMDGINGISSVEAIIAGLAYAYVGARESNALLEAAGLVVAAAAAGFLPYNFYRARVFLGDVGSYFLGGWLAALAVVALSSNAGIVAAAAPLTIYLGDTGATLLRRVRLGEAWLQPHKTHVYQRINQLGFSHTAVTAFVAAVTSACVLIGDSTVERSAVAQGGAALALALVVVGYLATPRLLTMWRLSTDAAS